MIEKILIHTVYMTLIFCVASDVKFERRQMLNAGWLVQGDKRLHCFFLPLQELSIFFYLHTFTGHLWDHHVRAFILAQLGHPGAPLQGERGSEENDDGHGAPPPLLQHLRHSQCQPKVIPARGLFSVYDPSSVPRWNKLFISSRPQLFIADFPNCDVICVLFPLQLNAKTS